MAHTVLVAGTASHVGKSTLVTGLCRLLTDAGVEVAPFKAQNMSNNAQVVLTPDGAWGEIGVSQYVQARAANVIPTTDHNPVLLKPRGDGESQLVIDGTAVADVSSRGYYDGYWKQARQAAIAAFERLEATNEVVVAEGAGSIAEINLHDRDLANVETARFADASIILTVDIDRGGAFASLYGTLELLPAGLRDQVVGAIITKFRGDASLLESGIAELETRTDVPILGVIPHDDPGLPAEDSVGLPDGGGRAVFGDDDGVAPDSTVTVAVPRFPHISNFTDLDPLAAEPGVRVAYVPLDSDLSDADAVVLPGSKNTVDDLAALHDAGFADRLRSFTGPVVGVCGGYQMLGDRITNAGVESTRDIDAIDGIGLLPVETRFSATKRVERVSRHIEGSGPLAGATGTVTGYEIHMGETSVNGPVDRPLGESSAATDRILGTYLHGLFENETARTAFVETLFRTADTRRPPRRDRPGSPADRAAALLAANVDFTQTGLPL